MCSSCGGCRCSPAPARSEGPASSCRRVTLHSGFTGGDGSSCVGAQGPAGGAASSPSGAPGAAAAATATAAGAWAAGPASLPAAAGAAPPAAPPAARPAAGCRSARCRLAAGTAGAGCLGGGGGMAPTPPPAGSAPPAVASGMIRLRPSPARTGAGRAAPEPGPGPSAVPNPTCVSPPDPMRPSRRAVRASSPPEGLAGLLTAGAGGCRLTGPGAAQRGSREAWFVSIYAAQRQQ